MYVCMYVCMYLSGERRHVSLGLRNPLPHDCKQLRDGGVGTAGNVKMWIWEWESVDMGM